MENKFNAHDIVTDGQFEFRVYKVLNLPDAVTPSYDVVSMTSNGHTVRSESELTMVRKYVRTEWNEETQTWITK